MDSILVCRSQPILVSYANLRSINNIQLTLLLAGFSSSNFFFSFFPTLLTMFLYLFLQTLDFALRRLAPFEALSTPGGATAESSILLDYSARLPISATLAAAANHHWRVALFTFVSFVTAFTLPVLASGLFFTQYYPADGELRVAAHPAAYYAMCFFLALYVATICTLATGRSDMALPHESRTLAETISWLYQSRILTDRAFSRPATKAELVARLMGPAYLNQKGCSSPSPKKRSPLHVLFPAGCDSKANLRAAAEKTQKEQNEIAASFATGGGHFPGDPVDDQHQGDLRMLAMEKRRSLLDPGSIMYGFGVHWGRDGREHLGVDRVQRGESRMMHFD